MTTRSRFKLWTSEIYLQRYHYTNPLGCITSREARPQRNSFEVRGSHSCAYCTSWIRHRVIGRTRTNNSSFQGRQTARQKWCGTQRTKGVLGLTAASSHWNTMDLMQAVSSIVKFMCLSFSQGLLTLWWEGQQISLKTIYPNYTASDDNNLQMTPLLRLYWHLIS